MRRLVRSTPVQSADDFFKNRVDPPVKTNLAVGSTIKVKTFCGVEIRCRIIAIRGSDIYDVEPAGDPMIREFQKAGCPVSESNAHNRFVAFDWQIIK